MGSLAAGSATMLGTSATTTFNVNDRDVGANVVTDSNGAVRLASRTPENDIVKENSSGELEIDFTNGSSSSTPDGVNVGSVVEIGNIKDPGINGDPAFVVENQSTADLDVKVDLEAGSSYSSGGSQLKIVAVPDSQGSGNQQEAVLNGTNSSGDVETIFDTDASNNPDAFDPLGPGSRVGFAIKVDADRSGASTSDNLQADLEITGTQN